MDASREGASAVMRRLRCAGGRARRKAGFGGRRGVLGDDPARSVDLVWRCRGRRRTLESSWTTSRGMAREQGSSGGACSSCAQRPRGDQRCLEARRTGRASHGSSRRAAAAFRGRAVQRRARRPEPALASGQRVPLTRGQSEPPEPRHCRPAGQLSPVLSAAVPGGVACRLSREDGFGSGARESDPAHKKTGLSAGMRGRAGRGPLERNQFWVRSGGRSL